MERVTSASHLDQWDDDHAWSAQEWKTDTEMYAAYRGDLD